MRYNENVLFQRAKKLLLKRTNYETFKSVPYAQMKFSLKRLRDFLDYLGYPDRQFAIVHVAGTKGKGTVCNDLDKIWRAAGYRVGLFTSPHINDFLERFQIDGKPCDKTFFAETMLGLTERWKAFDASYRKKYAEQFNSDVVTRDDNTNKEPTEPKDAQAETNPFDNANGSNFASNGSNDQINPPEFTFFEWSLVLALTLFARAGVQIAILEVGMGGTFDATNVCQADVSVITSISYDHCEQLGNTLEAIATEKAGVIKSDAPVVCGVGYSQLLYRDVENVLAKFAEIKQKREEMRLRALEQIAALESQNQDEATQEKASDTKSPKKNEPIAELLEQLPPLFDETVFKKEQFALLAHEETLVRPQELQRVKQIIQNKAISYNAPFYQIENLEPRVENLPTPPFDSIRKWNLQIALKVVDIMATRTALPSKYNEFSASRPIVFPVEPKDIAAALQRIDTPARFQTASNRPMIILDGAHNRASVAAVLRQLREHFPDKKIAVLFASTVGKDLPGMLAELFARADEIILTERAKAPRATPLAEIIQTAEDLLDYYCDENAAIRSALRVAPDYRAFLTDYCTRANRPNEILCVLGSFYFVADAKEVIASAKKV